MSQDGGTSLEFILNIVEGHTLMMQMGSFSAIAMRFVEVRDPLTV